jgi:(p)ppGpp synthase/HD superfamily hydrolase
VKTKTRRTQQPQCPLWQEAAAFAARAHRHQIRKDGKTPYVSHVFRVAMTVSQVFRCDDDAAIAAAVLHDTIEDTTTDFEDICERFGEEVAGVVAAMTKNMALPEDEREAEYDARLARADWRARLIKLADTYDNYSDACTFEDAWQVERRRENHEKCLRAIALGKPDTRSNPVMARAVAAVEALIARDGKPVRKARQRR